MKQYGANSWSPITLGLLVGMAHLGATVIVASFAIFHKSTAIQYVGQALLVVFILPVGWINPIFLFWVNSALIGVIAGLYIRMRRGRRRGPVLARSTAMRAERRTP